MLRQLPLFFPSVVQASRFAIVTDETVGNLFADELTQAFQECGMGVVPVFSFPAGEGFKTREVKSLVEDWLLEKKFLRDSCIIALGGGVVGDLAGFVAATYMRGIPVIQIPTTVLAMVDASIGGKTAVDVPAGKNLVGAFHHPNAVIIDIHLLRSLPDRHFYNGLAEIIKIGIVRDHELFVFMETHHEEILLRNFEALGFAIQRAAKAKSDIVKCDEKESGMRAILNFGHSIGHAIEALVGMESDGELLHGECVSIGMIYEALLARSMGFISTSTISRLENCLKLYHLPVSIPDHLSLRVNDIVEKMAVDKKNKGNSGMKNIVMLTGVGSSIENPWTKPVSDSQLKIVLCKSSLLISGKKAVGEVFVPGSKSVSNRILALAALGSGTTRIKGLLHSEDTHVMLDSLQKLGVKFEWKDAGSVLVLHGSGGTLQTPKEPLYLGNAGTASRFLTTIVTMVPGSSTILTGNSRMQERPISDLVDAIISTGCKIEYLNKTGSLPIRVFGGGFPGGEISLNANVSSQFVSSIMISAAHAKSPVRLKLIGDSVVSRPYIDMTTLLLRQFQIPVVEIDSNTFEIGQSKYINPPEILVEGDASSASYPLALAAITGGKVTVMNVGSSSTQGDAGFCHFLESMNCTVSQTESQTTVQGPDSNWDLRGVPEIDFEHLTDTFMTAAVVAAVANGVTRIRNISNQRVKECNRIQVMVEELTAIGIIAKELDDGIEIHGQPDISRLRVEGSHVKCHRDHRIAMSFAVLGAKVPNLIITDKACTGKTYPEFWDHLQLYLGLELDDRISDIVDKVEFSSMSHSSASIYIIGMRAAGKTTLGKVAAKHLGYQFVDLDEVIETMINGNIKRFVEENGWEEFRKVELKCLQMCSEKYKERCVISCGGGIVESPSAITILKSLPIVIMINRHIADIEADLSTESSRPKFSGTVRSVWQKRFPLLKSASNFEFYVSFFSFRP